MMLAGLRHSKLLRSGSIYLGFSVLTSLIKFFVMPVLSHYLSPEDMGVVGLFNVLLQLLAPLIGLSMNSILSRSYYNRTDFSALVGSGFILVTVMYCVVSMVISLTPEQVFDYFDYPKGLFLLTTAAAFFTINLASYLAILQMVERPVHWGVVTLLGVILDLCLTFGLLWLSDLTFMARIIGVSLANTVCCLVAMWMVRQQIEFRIGEWREHARYFLKLGVPLIVVALSGWGLNMFDRILLQQMLDLKQVGYYALAYTLASPMLVLGTSFSRAWAPSAYKSLADHQEMELFRKSLWVAASFTFFAVALAVIGPVLFRHLISPEFYPCLGLIPWLVGAMLVASWHKLWMPYLLHWGETRFMSLVTGAALVVNIGLNLLWIPSYGVTAAAIASLMSFLVMTGLTFWDVRRKAMLKTGMSYERT